MHAADGRRASWNVASFARGLLDPDAPPPAVRNAQVGYRVYRNNVTVSLVNALAEIFPAVRRITGDPFFRAIARAHVRASAPTSPLLFDYGHDFPDFIASHEHTQDMPWLADVARIERAWLDAYCAADAPPLAASRLASAPPEWLANAVFAPHPASRLVRSPHPAFSIFEANRRASEVAEIMARDPEDTLITRPGLDVAVRLLPPGAATFFSQLAEAKPLGAAAAAALHARPSFDLSAALALALEAGAFTSLKIDEEIP